MTNSQKEQICFRLDVRHEFCSPPRSSANKKGNLSTSAKLTKRIFQAKTQNFTAEIRLRLQDHLEMYFWTQHQRQMKRYMPHVYLLRQPTNYHCCLLIFIINCIITSLWSIIMICISYNPLGFKIALEICYTVCVGQDSSSSAAEGVWRKATAIKHWITSKRHWIIIIIIVIIEFPCNVRSCNATWHFYSAFIVTVSLWSTSLQMRSKVKDPDPFQFFLVLRQKIILCAKGKQMQS